MKSMVVNLTLALLVVAGSAAAQQPAPAAGTDAKWQPWIGCWQLLDESVQDESDVSADEVAAAGAPARATRAASGTRVCVAPAKGGVTMTTLIGSQPALEETIVADAVAHPIADTECRGTKRSEWSKTGHRLYTTAEIACADQAPRRVSSLTMMTGGPRWVDVQMIDINGRKNIRIRKFQRVFDQTTRTPSLAPFVGETSWTLEDIKEASSRLAPEAVQAALVELGSGFNLTGRQLRSLDAAGVPDSVIDLMVALSYPKHFVVERPVSSAPPPYGYRYGGLGGEWPWIADAAFWPSYYSPFAYRYWGYYDPYYVPSSGYVYVGQPAPGGTTPVASGEGRVVDGRGYTRVSTREPEPIRVSNFSGGTNSTSSSGGSSSSGSSSGSSGASSSGGYSSGGGGGGGGDTGRTAVPRPPGGN